MEAAFDGGLLTSDSGVMLLREVEARMGILYRIAQAFVDLFIASYKKPPEAILLDIDDTEDKVYGRKEILRLFPASCEG